MSVDPQAARAHGWCLRPNAVFDLPLIGYFPTIEQLDAGTVPDVMGATSIADIAAGRDPVIRSATAWLINAGKIDR